MTYMVLTDNRKKSDWQDNLPTSIWTAYLLITFRLSAEDLSETAKLSCPLYCQPKACKMRKKLIATVLYWRWLVWSKKKHNKTDLNLKPMFPSTRYHWKLAAVPDGELRRGVHLPYVGLEPVGGKPQSLWHMASASPLIFPASERHHPLTGYTAWWQRHTGVSSSPKATANSDLDSVFCTCIQNAKNKKTKQTIVHCAMVLRQDSNPRPINCKPDTLPIAHHATSSTRAELKTKDMISDSGSNCNIYIKRTTMHFQTSQ